MTDVQVAEWAEITTDCTCEDEDGNTATDCYGCYDEAVAYLSDYLIPEWVKQNGDNATDLVLVTGHGMGWQRLYGWTNARVGELLEAVTLNGDYRIRFELLDGILIAHRYSHDEPTGAKFEFAFVPDED